MPFYQVGSLNLIYFLTFEKASTDGRGFSFYLTPPSLSIDRQTRSSGTSPLYLELPLGRKYVRSNPEMVYFLIFLRPIESRNKTQSLVCVPIPGLCPHRPVQQSSVRSVRTQTEVELNRAPTKYYVACATMKVH